MNLKKILTGVDFKVIKGDISKEISNIIQVDSEVHEGSLYICVKGSRFDGHKFAKEAVKRGAKAILCVDDVDVESDEVTIIKVLDIRKAMAIAASNFEENPSSKLKLIGITGTNGKTTSAFIIKDILEKAGYKVGLIGTIANYIGDKVITSQRTTPGPIELHKLFKKMVDEDVKYCVMEVSSHSLDQDRVYGLNFQCGIYTNLTRDHLDYHKTFEEYYKAKFKLFKMSKYAIVNIDDSYGERIVKDIKELNKNKKIITYGITNDCDIKACHIIGTEKGSSFNVKIKDKNYNTFIDIAGDYNVYNGLGAIGACLELGINSKYIFDGLKDVVVPGRCEAVGCEFNLPFEIIIDYAHTPDGLDKILKTARGFTKNKLISVFGCGGDRDKIKRPIMGQIGSSLSDIAIITSDNPRTEEPSQIIKEITEGIKSDNFIVIENRYEAIKKAIEIAKAGDVIVIAGKGHETYQVLRDKTIDFDERKVVKEILNNYEVRK